MGCNPTVNQKPTLCSVGQPRSGTEAANTPDGDRLFEQAGQKYAEAVRIKPDKHEAFFNWGNALSDQAKLKGNTPDGDRLFEQAGQKYAEAVRIKPDNHEAHFNLACIAAHTKVARGRKRDVNKLDFEIFVPVIILDRNSQVCFHRSLITGRVTKPNRARCHARPIV